MMRERGRPPAWVMKMCNECLTTLAVPRCLYQDLRLCVLMHISNLLCIYIDYYFTLILVRRLKYTIP